MSRKYNLPLKPLGASTALALSSEKNPALLPALNAHYETVTTDPNEIENVDVVYFVSELSIPPMGTVKDMDWVQVSATEVFETPSQTSLRELDWKMLKTLESLLPEDHELRVERDALRIEVDSELS